MTARTGRKIFKELHAECWFFRDRRREETGDEEYEPLEEEYETMVLAKYDCELSDDVAWQLRLAVDTVRRDIPPKL